MKESIYKYFDLGILQWMSYPGQDPMQSLRTICRDPFFTLIETAGFGGGEQTAAARALLDQSHLTVLGAAHPVMLGRGLNPNALAEEERRAAEDYLLQLVDESLHLPALESAVLLYRLRDVVRMNLSARHGLRKPLAAAVFFLEPTLSKFDKYCHNFLNVWFYNAKVMLV